MLRKQRDDMTKYLTMLERNPLFEGISREEFRRMLSCAGAYVSRHDVGAEIIRQRGIVDAVGIMLSGTAQAVRMDIGGKRFVQTRLVPGSIFGVVLSVGIRSKSPVCVVAIEPAECLRIPVRFILNRCNICCECHDRLMRNMLNVISDKYFELQDRLNCVIKPSLREKILYYLNGLRCGDSTVTIPFDREGFADYLNADRSALSRELSAMKREGLIDYHKNVFRVFSL